VAPNASVCPTCGRIIHIRAVDYGGFWIRLFAWVIDAVIITGVDAAIEVTVDGAIATGIMQAFAGAAYTIGFWLAVAATPGKMVLGLRIVMADGRRLQPGAALVRYVGTYISAILIFIGYLMIAFRADKRALHDLIAGTMVIRAR
jgi:uncharacterized RDD family membrane protein YckC